MAWNRPTYADLTASELAYLADSGSQAAAECLDKRARKGEVEALHLTTGMGQELLGESVLLGADAAQTPTPPAGAQSLDSMMPAQIITSAFNAASSIANAVAASKRPPMAPVVRALVAPRVNVAPMRRPIRPIIVRPRFPQWGVFIDYQQQPVETFDTLTAANDYAQATASGFPSGFPVFVIHAGQEPPRAPYGYTSQLQPDVPTPYSSMDYAQDIAASDGLSAYQAYQLAQGQRI